MLPLDVRRVDLWLTEPDAIQSPDLLARYRALLTPAERERVDRFRFVKDRHRALVTRALVRTVLSRYAPIAPTEWTFEANEHGRPRFTNEVSAVANLSFNLSHTTELIALIVADRRVVGVDTEYLERKNATVAIAERFFAPREVTQLAALPHELQHESFFQYWTLKESYIKARGMGLALPLDKFSFDLSRARQIDLAVDPALNDTGSRWMFWLLQPSAKHLIAACVERSDFATTLAIRTVIPLTSEAEIDHPLIRMSPEIGRASPTT